MPNFPVPGRRDVGSLSDDALTALLAGTEPPAEDAPSLQPVADVMAALRAGPASDELAGEGTAMAEFRRSAGTLPAARPTARRRRRLVAGPVFGARAAVAAAVAALSLGGLATAAYAGVLPGPVQQFAHDTIGAPASEPAAVHASDHSHLVGHAVHPGQSRSHEPHKQGQPGKAGRHGKAGEHGKSGQHGKSGEHGQGRPQRKGPPPGKRNPPGKRRGQHKHHSHGKHTAHRTGRGQHPHALRFGGSAPKNPARHRAVTSRS